MCRIVSFAAAMLLGTCLAGIAQQPASIHNFTLVTDDMLQNPNPKDWLMRQRGYQAWGYSPLKHITPQNVNQRQLAWAWTTEPGNQEAEPLVSNGIMFLAQSRNVVQALEARTGDRIWEYRRKLPDVKASYHRRQYERQRNSIAPYENKVFLTTGDAHLVALDARTGEVVWEVAVADYQPGFNYTGGPLVVKGKVIKRFVPAELTPPR